MQHPICAMKICGGINGDFSMVTSRPELRLDWQHEHGDAGRLGWQCTAATTSAARCRRVFKKAFCKLA